MSNIQKIIVAMSGGVDSSVSALLLKQQGYVVEGMFMKNWEEDDNEHYCAASQDIQDAQQVCDLLDIPLHKVNFSAEYWDNVFEYFLQEYRAGRTPNPDILCNKEIKFKAFLDYAYSLGASHIATGHYARVRHQHDFTLLLKGKDSNKDQSYFLYALSQTQLKNVLFPIGELNKPDVRRLAQHHKLPVFDKKDSTGICFIGERKFNDFLKQYLPSQPGVIETELGEKIGMHQGLMYYTIGQRKGIGIGGTKNKTESPWFVLDKDLKRNVLIVGQGTHHPMLYKKQLIATQLNWISGSPPDNTRQYQAKIRYRQTPEPCQLSSVALSSFAQSSMEGFEDVRTRDGREPEHRMCVPHPPPSTTAQKMDLINTDTIHVIFDQPQRAVTPGQSIVIYDNDICLGGGVIIDAA